MGIKFPDYLVAVDKSRNRVFVMEKPYLIAVKRDGIWHYGERISDEEIELSYELITDPQAARAYLDEAKIELNIA